jgi:protein-disulfide isomerase
VSKRAEQRRERRSAASSGGSSSRLTWILGGAAVLGVGIVAWNLFSSAVDGTVRGPVPFEYSSAQELLERAEGVPSGNPDAPIRIMEFADYQCPSCREFFQLAKPFIDMTYIEEGTVQFVLYDFPLYEGHQNAFLAARAARCAGDQDQYWAFHDRLFQTQSQWALRSDPVGDFIGFAQDLGLNRDVFSSCLRSDQHAEVVMANRRLGEQLGVQGTPTILVDTGQGPAVRLQDWGIESIRRTVDEALADMQGTQVPEEPAPSGDGQ